MNAEQQDAFNAHYEKLSITNNFYQSICETATEEQRPAVYKIDWDKVMHRMWERGVCVSPKPRPALTVEQFDAAANARLIAAAPDLLKELQHLVRLLQPLEENGGFNVPGLATLNGARLAIAKATTPTPQ